MTREQYIADSAAEIAAARAARHPDTSYSEATLEEITRLAIADAVELANELERQDCAPWRKPALNE